MIYEKDHQEALRRIDEVIHSGKLTLDLSGLELFNIPSQVASCQHLQELNLSYTQVSAIDNLPESLQTLFLSGTQVSEIDSLPEGLQTLYLMGTQVSVIDNLPDGLQALYLSNTQVSIIANLPEGLQTLNLMGTHVSVINNLPKGLQRLDLRNTQVNAIANLTEGLQRLDLSYTTVSAIVNLPNSLQTLDLRNTQVSEIANLPASLQTLDLSGTQVSEIANLPEGLQMLDLSYTKLRAIGNLPNSLETLYLTGCEPKNIPTELLGSRFYDNCLLNVKAWFLDLAKQAEPNMMMKFMISGNSNVGKSSILEALRVGKANLDQESTHGIRIVPLLLQDQEMSIDGLAFDFGGQEIYHGTHQLFMRSRAIHVVVFDAETEATFIAPDRRLVQGEKNRNKTLLDWINNLRQLSPKSAFVLVENKSEKAITLPSNIREFINQLDVNQEVWTSRVSAWTGRNIAALRGVLAEAARSLPEYGMLIPASWISVRQYFLKNSQKPVGERERAVSIGFFKQLCLLHNVLPEAEYVLLRYLHDTGIVYYDSNYLTNIIIADQQWAIEAIYAVLDRQGQLYDELANETYGKKRRKYLFSYFDECYTAADHRLFLSLMESCGLCFPLKEEGVYRVTDDTYYLFPQFLPDSQPDSVTYFLTNKANLLVYEQMVKFLPYYHIQHIITRWGVKTDIRNIWRTGLLIILPEEGIFVLEANLLSNTLILTLEQRFTDESIACFLEEFSYPDADWQLANAGSTSNKESVSPLSISLFDEALNVVQPKIKKLVVSFAKEDVRYVNLLRQKMAARKTIDLWYDRHLTGWQDWDNQIQQHFTDCDGYIIFVSDSYMDAEMKEYIHQKEIPLIRQRFDAKETFVAVINISSYNTQDTELSPFLAFKKAALMPDPDKNSIEASQFLEEFISEKLLKDFLSK